MQLVDFLVNNAELNAIETDKEVTQLTLNYSQSYQVYQIVHSLLLTANIFPTFF